MELSNAGRKFGTCYFGRERRAGVRVPVGLNLLLLSLVMGLLGTGRAEMPQACEIIDPNSLQKPEVSVTFDENLFLTILANQKDSWNVTATISDATGLECTFGLGRKPGKRIEYLTCPQENSHYNSTVNEPLPDYVTNMTHVALDVEPKQTCAFHREENRTSCMGSLRITFPQLLRKENYVTEWHRNPLKPPLTMRVEQISNGKLAFNCKNTDCLQTSGKLKERKGDLRKTFFLKPAASFRGLTIFLNEDQNFFVTKDNLLNVYEGSWFNITLVKEGNFSKVFVNSKESYREPGDTQVFLIKSAQVNGSGLLSWCDPRQGGKKSNFVSGLNNNNHHELLIYWISVALLLFIITVLFVVICCLAKKCRLSQKYSGSLPTRFYRNHEEETVVINRPGVQMDSDEHIYAEAEPFALPKGMYSNEVIYAELEPITNPRPKPGRFPPKGEVHSNGTIYAEIHPGTDVKPENGALNWDSEGVYVDMSQKMKQLS